ncbi:MAG TPA: hypothetical protein VFU21_29250, partial [Kofleriaceae bacterium]|nr:hypothetical protein [Kofleriaceae bacterium]
VAVLSPRALARLCVAMIAVAIGLRLALTVASAPHWTVYALTPARWDGLALGALVAIALRAPGGERALDRFPLAIGGGLLGIFAVFVVSGGLAKESDAFAVWGFTSLALLFAGLTVAALRAAPGGRLHALLTSRWLCAIGAVSYAMYLWQMVTRYAFRAFLWQWLEERAGFWPTQLASVLFVLATTFALAWLSWHLVESRFLRLKRHFPYATVDQRRPWRSSSR